MRVFPVLELPLLTSPYCSLKTRCCGYTTKQAAAEWGDDRLAGFFFAPCLQFCCSQCRSGRRTPVDLGKKQESVAASLKIMIKLYFLQCVRGPKAVGFTMPHSLCQEWVRNYRRPPGTYIAWCLQLLCKKSWFFLLYTLYPRFSLRSWAIFVMCIVLITAYCDQEVECLLLILLFLTKKGTYKECTCLILNT